MQEITPAEYAHRMRENASSSTPVFNLSNVKIKGEDLPNDVRVTREICDADAGRASIFVEVRKTLHGDMHVFRGQTSGDVEFGIVSGDERVFTERDDLRAVEVPQFWILAWDPKGELEESEGFWTKEQREERAIGWLETGWTVTYSTAALQAVRRIEDVLRYWRDMRQSAEEDLREHAETNPTGCPVGCEQCANLLKAYDATLTPSERAEGERKTEQATQGDAEHAEQRLLERAMLAGESYRKAKEIFPWLQPEASLEVRQDRFKVLQAEWIDALQLIDNPSWTDDERTEAHGRWLYNLSDTDKAIWNEFVTQD